MKRQRGFTLTELLVMMVVFSLFTTTALAVLRLVLNFWNASNATVAAEQNARIGLDVMINEARQAVPDADPGAAGVTASGYLSITPSVSSTGFLMPNQNVTTAAQLIFNEPSTAFDPSSSAFSMTSPLCFQTVRYYVTGGALTRDLTTYSASGAPTVTSSVIVSATSRGSLTLAVTWLASDAVRISLTAQEVAKTCTLAETLYTYHP